MTLEITTSDLLFYINTAVQLYLSVFFFNRYRKDHTKISLVWSAGFLFYGTSGIVFEAMTGDLIPKDYASLFVRATFIALGIGFFYYGTSLLFFKNKSFKREKGSIVLVSIMILINIYYIYILPDPKIDNLISVLNNLYVYVFLVPIFLLISFLFANAASDLKYGDPRRVNLFLVSAAWGGIAFFNFFYPMTYSSETHAIIRVGAIVSRLLLLIGMTKFAANMSSRK